MNANRITLRATGENKNKYKNKNKRQRGRERLFREIIFKKLKLSQNTKAS